MPGSGWSGSLTLPAAPRRRVCRAPFLPRCHSATVPVRSKGGIIGRTFFSDTLRPPSFSLSLCSSLYHLILPVQSPAFRISRYADSELMNLVFRDQRKVEMMVKIVTERGSVMKQLSFSWCRVVPAAVMSVLKCVCIMCLCVSVCIFVHTSLCIYGCCLSISYANHEPAFVV